MSTDAAPARDLAREIEEIGPWFHQIDLDGLRTRDIAPAPGPQPTEHPLARWESIERWIPRDLSTMRILDLGCADGFFAVELARRGAESIVAIDPWSLAIKRVDFVKSVLGLETIDARVGSIYELDPETTGRFDFVLMLAVLYHLDHPLLGLEKVAALTDTVYIDSVTINDDDRSYLHLRHPEDAPGAQTKPKWIPTRRCMREMLEIVGFDNITEIPTERNDRTTFFARKTTQPSPSPHVTTRT